MRRAAGVIAICVAACSRSSASAPALAPALACRSLDARTAEARSLYGADVRVATVDGTFLFVDPDHGLLFPEVLRFAPRVLTALRHDRIAARPLCPVSVYVFASHDRYQAHCGERRYVPGSGQNLGIYDADRGEIVTDLSGGRAYVPTIAHELAHTIMDSDWGWAPDTSKTSTKAPLWFRECVASVYESPVLTAEGEIHGTDDWRYTQLRAAVAAHDPEAHLGALFGMSDADFNGERKGRIDGTRSLLHRATARAVCQWLDAQGQLWPVYGGWRDDRAADPDGVATFTRVTGRAPSAVEADAAWRAWVMRTR